jgi:hypothetical protein
MESIIAELYYLADLVAASSPGGGEILIGFF